MKRLRLCLTILALLTVTVYPTLARNNNVERPDTGGRVRPETWNVGRLRLAGEGVWTQCSQGMWGSARISTLAFSPGYATDHTLFVGTWDGVFKSSDGGASWSALNTGLTNLNVYDLAFSPGYGSGSDRTLFAGTGGSTQIGRVFKSTDGGASWNVTGLTQRDVRSLALSPGYVSDLTLFAGTWGDGIFKSTDGGTSWSPVNTGLTNLDMSDLVLSPGYAADHTLFAGTNGGVFKSTDGGANWSATGLTNFVYPLALSPDYTADHTIFAGTWGGGVFKSTDGGASWSYMGLASLYVSGLALSPGYASDHTLFAGAWGGGVFKSTDGGASWSAMNAGLGNLYIESLAVTLTSPRTLFAGTNGGGVWQYVKCRLYLPIVLKNLTSPPCDPYEPNDSLTQPWRLALVSGQSYQANLCTVDVDPEDNYFFDVTTTNPVQLYLDLPGSLVNHTSIWLYAQSDLSKPNYQPICGTGPVTTAPYIRQCPIPDTGRYIIRLYTDGAADDVNPYTLRATFQ